MDVGPQKCLEITRFEAKMRDFEGFMAQIGLISENFSPK